MNFDHRIVPTRLVKSQTTKKSCKGKRKNGESSSLKVVYISSPMKVKTSASRFRSLVQELTGKNSDISQYMDDDNPTNRCTEEFHHVIDCDDQTSEDHRCDHRKLSSNVSPDDTPTSSEYSFGGAVDDSLFISQMKDQFEGIFSYDSFYDPSEMDVLASFDELL